MEKAIRILYVEDIPSDAELVLREISKSGIHFTHLVVETKEDYIDALVNFIPDLIISDYFLPQFNGLNALSLRNEIALHTPFILVTGSTNEEVVAECMKAGADDYVLKTNLSRLINSIQASLAKRNAILLKLQNESFLRFEEKFKTAKQLVLKKTDNSQTLESETKGEAFLDEKMVFLDMVIESIGIGTWVYDISANTWYLNTKASQLLGLEADEIKISEEEFLAHCHKEDRRKLKYLFINAIRKRSDLETNFRALWPNGTVKFLDTKVKPILNSRGVPERLYGMVWDTTDQKLLLVKLQENIRKTNSIINNLNGAVFRCLYDNSFTIEYFSEGILELSGFPVSDFLMNRVRSFISLIFKEDKPRVIKIIDEALTQNKPFVTEFRIISDVGEVKWIWARGRGVFAGEKIVAIEGFLTDISERKKTEDELKGSLEQLHELTQYIEKVREKERKAISRELHDDLGQALTAIKIDLGNIKQTITDPETNKKVSKVIGVVGDTIKSVQRLTEQLRPPIISDLGLEAAIEWYVKEFCERTKLDFSLDVKHLLDISPDVSLAIFRIMQESLTNIARHSKATHVSINFSKSNESIILVISDNGIGITDEQINSKKSFGIISMKERARALGGFLKIFRDKNNGTVNELIIPIK